jgi:NAD(P)-dependent dehydrogenase (short-subunit alcohol dehydrogenase family)
VPERAPRWTAADVPSQQGRTVVITGANSGVGFETAKVLAARGATVVLACRDPERARQAVARLIAFAPGAQVDTVPLDLASLASVRAAAAELRSRHPRVDVLINNAGVMWAPRGRTADGFETHLGTNHLGHFAFTGLVLDLLLPVARSRVVVLSSPAHRDGRIDFGDLGYDRRFRRAAAYGRSKLANLLFAQLLQARLDQAGAATAAVAAHPGAARTELNRHMPVVFRGPSWGLARPITHPAEIGALSLLRAATDPGLPGGSYVGPDGWHEFTGYPVLVQPSERARDPELQRRLWQESERLTGVTYHFSAAAV